jgi:C-terminal general transcription factor TFIIE alpha
MAMSAPIIELLKETDKLSIPAFHLEDYIESANQAADEANQEQSIRIITSEEALNATATQSQPTLSTATAMFFGGQSSGSAMSQDMKESTITVDIQSFTADSIKEYQSFYQAASHPKSDLPVLPETKLERSASPSASPSAPMVLVAGQEYSLSAITDELLEKMTSEEYEAYYSILSSQ